MEGFPVHSRRGGCSCRGCSQERMVQDPRKAFGILWSIFFLPPILTYTFTFVDSRFILDPIIYKYCIICTPDSFFFTCQLVLIVVSSLFRGSLSVSRRGSVEDIFLLSLISDFSHLSQIHTNIVQTFHSADFP